MIAYDEPLYRPPSEADSLILQVTIGCSYNRCTFCAMYRHKKFRVRPFGEIDAEIARVAGVAGARVRKVFLADGDALVAKAAHLERVLIRLREAFSHLRRVGVYASPQSLEIRSVDEMRRLRELGLSLYYLGIESGHDEVLERLDKGVDAARMVACAVKAREAGVKLSTMVLLGAGGRTLSIEHAEASAAVVDAIAPRFVSTLVMTPVEGTPLWERALAGGVETLDPIELAVELRAFLRRLELDGAVFRSNHASNWLALAGTLRKDKKRLVETLDAVIDSPEQAPFRPGFLRGL